MFVNSFIKPWVYRRLNRYKNLAIRSQMLGGFANAFKLHTARCGLLRELVRAADLPRIPEIYSKFTILKKGEVLHRPLPNTIEPEIHEVFNQNLECQHEDFYALELKGAYVMSDKGWVMTSDRRFLTDSLADSAFIEKRRIAEIVIWPKVTHIKDTVILAYPHWAVNNYYHWLLEFLPRISPVITPSAYRQLDIDLSQAKILIPPYSLPWINETLKMLGVSKEQLLVPNRNQLQVDDLIFMSRVGKPMNTPVWAIHWLRDHLKSDISQQQPIKRVLISRKKAAKRRIVNDYEVEKALEVYGFRSVILEELSVSDQIALLAK